MTEQEAYQWLIENKAMITAFDSKCGYGFSIRVGEYSHFVFENGTDLVNWYLIPAITALKKVMADG